MHWSQYYKCLKIKPSKEKKSNKRNITKKQIWSKSIQVIKLIVEDFYRSIIRANMETASQKKEDSE